MEGLPANGYKILLQHEQTILSRNFPQEEAFPGGIRENDEGCFLVRLYGPEAGFVAADAVIDYSNTNIRNVLSSDKAFLYEAKAQYVAPLLGNQKEISEPRPNGQVATMFGSPHLGRRAKFLRELSESGVSVTNIREYDDYNIAFSDTSILLNYRQYNHFQTLEELRVLPALMRGVIVLSERGPLWEHVPFAQVLEAFDPGEIVSSIRDLQATYKAVWESTFRVNFPPILDNLVKENEAAFRAIARREALHA